MQSYQDADPLRAEMDFISTDFGADGSSRFPSIQT